MSPAGIAHRVFQSTHLIRGATPAVADLLVSILISIHAPHTRCDKCRLTLTRLKPYFNPRTSYEVRHGFLNQLGHGPDFNPRTSYEVRRNGTLSIVRKPANFNPRTSYEVRRIDPCVRDTRDNFNPRTSYEVRRSGRMRRRSSRNFNPRTSYEVRPEVHEAGQGDGDFNPRTSYEVRLLG